MSCLHRAGVPQNINNTVIIISKHKLSLWGDEKKKGQAYGESPGRSWRVILKRNLWVSSAESVTFEKRPEGGKSSSWKHVSEPLHKDTTVNTNPSSRDLLV